MQRCIKIQSEFSINANSCASQWLGGPIYGLLNWSWAQEGAHGPSAHGTMGLHAQMDQRIAYFVHERMGSWGDTHDSVASIIGTD